MLRSYKRKEIYKTLSDKYNINQKVIEAICNHPFVFAKRVMMDRLDERPLMFHYFAKIKLKPRFIGNKEEQIDLIQKRIDERMVAMGYKTKEEYDLLKEQKRCQELNQNQSL